MTHICIGKLTIIGSNNGLSPERRQAIIWTNAGILLIGPLGTNFSETLIEIHTFSLKKIRLKMSTAKCCSFRLGLNVLRTSHVSLLGLSLGLFQYKDCLSRYKDAIHVKLPWIFLGAPLIFNGAHRNIQGNWQVWSLIVKITWSWYHLIFMIRSPILVRQHLYINSLWPSDAIWRHGSGSTLAQVMACCLTAPSHYLNHVDLSSMRSYDIFLRTISQEMPLPSITKIRLKITYMKFHLNVPGANEQPSGTLIS